MEKINIAELLKDCPQGMELDCTMYKDCKFLDVEAEGNRYLLRITTPCGIKYLDKYGCYTTSDKAKCVIFPKGKTTWDGFVPPCRFKDGDKFKDGDIVAAKTDSGLQVFILQKAKGDYEGHCYIGYDFVCDEVFDAGEWVFNRLATEEEKQKLFDAIKSNGYKWNAETKTLEKLIEPKFKVGNRIKKKNFNEDAVLIVDIDIANNYYIVETKYGMEIPISIDIQDNWELIHNKFDINTLVPFESRVLVRDYNSHEWEGDIYTRCNSNHFVTLGGRRWKQCIPYNDNTTHLLGTTNDCNEYYKTWKQ